jgi:hypothetical protein
MHKLFIVIFAICFSMKGSGQNEITINPFGTDIPIRKVKFGNTVKFKINNVNTFKIHGIIDSKSINIDFGVPIIFNDFLNPNLNSINNGPVTIATLDDKKLEFLKSFSIFITSFNCVHQQIELEEKLFEQIKDSVFIKDTSILKRNVRDYYFAVYNNMATDSAKKETEKLLNNLLIENSILQNLYEEINKVVEVDSVVVSGELKSNDKKTTFKINNAQLLQQKNNHFFVEISSVKKVIDNLLDVKNRNQIIKKAQDGIDLYNKIENADFVAYTDAIQINDDEVIATPQLKFNNGNLAHEFNPYTIRSFDRIKVNFSTGYLLSFKGDENYGITKDSSGASIEIKQGNKNHITHSLGGLVHAYFQSKYNTSFGISAGASLTTTGNVGFYFGGSALFLEKNRLVFTFGYSLIKIKKLNKSNLNSNEKNAESYTFSNNKDTEIKYDDVYAGALFIGVTYNLSN